MENRNVEPSTWGYDPNTASHFKHLPLMSKHHIRLLEIKPGTENQPLEAVLKEIDLSKPVASSRPKYQALSYYWGTDSPTDEIRIQHGGARWHQVGRQLERQRERQTSVFNDAPVDGFIFKIRRNLFDLLKNVRDRKESVAIWTDAICINQRDLTERSVQVERMGEVYAAAEHVIVWLGHGDSHEAEERTFKHLQKMLNILALEHMTVQSGTEEFIEDWKLIVKLMNNQWFSRRWVIQELALAKKATVYYGKAKLDWTMFSRAVALFIKKFDDISAPLTKDLRQNSYLICHPEMYPSGANLLVDLTTHLFQKDERYVILQKRLTLEVLVSTLLPYESANPRDAIYALLGIAKDTSGASASPTKDLDPRLKPDYKKQLVDVCTDFMDYCISTSNSLDILCRNWAPKSVSEEGLERSNQRWDMVRNMISPKRQPLPSWLPSIHKSAYGAAKETVNGRRNADSLVGVSNRRNNQHYCASADLQPVWEFERFANTVSFTQSNSVRPPPARRRPRTRQQSVVEEDAETANQQSDPSRETAFNKRRKLNETDDRAEDQPRKYNGTFCVRGIEIGTVEHCTTRAAGAIIHLDVLKMFGWKGKDQVMDSFEDFWRTIVADRGPAGVSIPAWYAAACTQALQWYNEGANFLNIPDVRHNWEKTPEIMKEFLKRVEAVIWGRTFFEMHPTVGSKISYKCFGLGPDDSKVGDLVCVLFGCSVPVVLRRTAPDDYEFIGECYVHGIMDGEAVQGLSTQNLNEVERRNLGSLFKIK